MVSSGLNSTSVPFFSFEEVNLCSFINSPLLNSAVLDCPSRKAVTLKLIDNAFTALVPTPFNPIDFLNASLSYFPPVFILETTSTTLPNGIPLP